MKKPLLIRFRAYIFALMLIGGIGASLGYTFHNTDVTSWGIVIFLGGACVAVVLNTIDETEERIGQ